MTIERCYTCELAESTNGNVVYLPFSTAVSSFALTLVEASLAVPSQNFSVAMMCLDFHLVVKHGVYLAVQKRDAHLL